MQENWVEIANSYEQEKPFVLAVIVATKGSTYRKTGTMMLISAQGHCTGLLSGGCLEADIALHAESVFSSGKPELIEYDLSVDADLLWGLGLGCDGAIDIQLYPLLTKEQKQPFELLLDSVSSGQSGFYSLPTTLGSSQLGVFIDSRDLPENYTEKDVETIAHLNIDGEQLIIPVAPIVHVLVCGAGPDVAPVVAFCHQLGWRVTLQDHRESHLSADVFQDCFAKRKQRPEHCTEQDFNGFNAIVVMTHNLAFDEQILANALAASSPYIGILGPAGRRDKLLSSVGVDYEQVKGKVFGPIGLDLGGRSPQAIALSICAQIQQEITGSNSGQTKPWRCGGLNDI